MTNKKAAPEETSVEAPPEEEKAEEYKAQWKYKERFPIQDKMAEVVKLTKAAAEKELEGLHKKLRKMQYGS